MSGPASQIRKLLYWIAAIAFCASPGRYRQKWTIQQGHQTRTRTNERLAAAMLPTAPVHLTVT